MGSIQFPSSMGLLAKAIGKQDWKIIWSDWINWEGGDVPVHKDTFVEVELRNGFKSTGRAGRGRWGHEKNDFDIVRYRHDIPASD